MHYKLAALAALAVCSASSFAITIRFDSTAMGGTVDYVYNGNNRSNFAGQLNFTNLDNNTPLVTYCVDLDNFIGGGQTYGTNPSNTLGDPTYGLAGSVFANSYATVSSNDMAMAMQIAIWSARYGTDLNTNTGGTFQLQSGWYSSNTAIVTLAQGFYNLGGANPMNATLLASNPSNAGQSQLAPAAVPEPASMAVLGVGLVGAIRRRRKSAK